MEQYRLGVLGGMGPQATNTFYQYIIDRTDARTDQDHVNALILSDCQMPDRTGAILGSEADREAVYQRLLADACWRGRGAPLSPFPATPPISFWTGYSSRFTFPSST